MTVHELHELTRIRKKEVKKSGFYCPALAGAINPWAFNRRKSVTFQHTKPVNTISASMVCRKKRLNGEIADWLNSPKMTRQRKESEQVIGPVKYLV